MPCALLQNMILHLDLSKEIVESHNFDWTKPFRTHIHPSKDYICSDCGVVITELAIGPGRKSEYWIYSAHQQKCNDRIMLQIME